MLRILSLLAFVLFGANAFAAQMTEQEKITALLNAFDNPNITLIRNGEEHDGAWAKKHFSEKMASAKPAVKTANEFIKNVASNSSESGKPYIIKTKDDGKTMQSAEWLQVKLNVMLQPSAGKLDTSKPLSDTAK